MENKLKEQKPTADTVLKEWLINYVGTKKSPKDDDVTVEMIVETVAEEFPEFLFLVAQENFLRGYGQGLDDAREVNQGMTNVSQEEENN